MKKKTMLFVIIVLFFSNLTFSQTKNQSAKEYTWTFTYLKANEGQKERLKQYLEKNWLTIDDTAVKKKLFKSYELIENITENSLVEWDFMVAVEYFDIKTYETIAKDFEEIRKNHKTILIDNLSFKELGKIIKSEKTKRKKYPK